MEHERLSKVWYHDTLAADLSRGGCCRLSRCWRSALGGAGEGRRECMCGALGRIGAGRPLFALAAWGAGPIFSPRANGWAVAAEGKAPLAARRGFLLPVGL